MSELFNSIAVEVGTVTLNEPFVFRDPGNNESGFRDYVFAPGAYPLYAKVGDEQVALMTSPVTAVVFACNDRREIGSSKLMRIPVFPADVLGDKMSIDFMSAYEFVFDISDQNPYGVKTFVGNPDQDEPAWKHLVTRSKTTN